MSQSAASKTSVVVLSALSVLALASELAFGFALGLTLAAPRRSLLPASECFALVGYRGLWSKESTILA